MLEIIYFVRCIQVILLHYYYGGKGADSGWIGLVGERA